MPRRYKRKLGDRVLYTPNQTQRYKSQWTRYQKGLALAESNQIHEHEPNLYRIPSERSPVGYWEVTAGGMSGGAVIYQCYGIADGNGDGYVSLQILSRIDGINGDTSVPQNIYPSTTLTYADIVSLLEPDGEEFHEYTNGVNGETAGTSYDYYTSIRRTLDKNKIIAYYSQNFPVAVQVPTTHILAFDFYVPIDYAVTPTEATFNIIFTPLNPIPPLFSVSVPTNPVALTFPETHNDFKRQSVTFEITHDFLTPPGFFEYGISIELTNLTGQQQSGYKCTCPDYSKFEDAFVPPEFPSMAFPRDWVDSSAGAPIWDDGKRRCYHIVGVQHLRGEPIPVPSDFPLGEA